MKDYLTPEMKFIRLMLSDVIEGSATVNSYKGETLQADTLISGNTFMGQYAPPSQEESTGGGDM